MASTRLRKTFQYEENSSDDEPLAMDEQEQDELIANLQKENNEKNDIYLQLFLIVPGASCLLFLFGFIFASSPAGRLLCMLGITSLVATAYNLMLIPTRSNGPQQRPARIGPYQIPISDSLSPAQKYIPILNGALSVLVALWGLSFRHSQQVVSGFWMTCCLPLIEYVMIQMARRWIVEVDPSELVQLKYEFKGA